MWTTAIDDPGHRSVCLFRSFTWLHCANTAEWIVVLLGLETLSDLRNIVLDVSPDFPTDLMQPLPNYFGHLF